MKMSDDYVRELAKCRDFDISIRDGYFMMSGTFEYEGGSAQGLGYMIDTEFIRSFMEVFPVEYLREVDGKSCWVTHNQSNIKLIEPLHKKDGKPFDIEKWGNEL